MYHNNYFQESGTVPVVYQNYLSSSSLSSINSTVLPFAKPTSISGNFTVVKLATNYKSNYDYTYVSSPSRGFICAYFHVCDPNAIIIFIPRSV